MRAFFGGTISLLSHRDREFDNVRDCGLAARGGEDSSEWMWRLFSGRKKTGTFNTEGTETLCRGWEVDDSQGGRLSTDNGAWLEDVGKEFINKVVVLLFDHAAFELHGESEAAAIEGEVVGKERETLDGFVGGEVSGETVDFLFDEGIRPRMDGKLRL